MKGLTTASIFCLALAGQTVSPQLPTQHLYNAFWTTGTFQSVAHLHNNRSDTALTITPVLYLANGDQIRLSSVSIQPLGNAVIELNQQVAPNLSGSADFQYSAKAGGALTAEIYCENIAKSLSFTIPNPTTPILSSQQNAVFWLPSARAEVYAAFQNTSDEIVHVTPTVNLGSANLVLPTLILPPHGSGTAEVDAGDIAGWTKDAVGSLKVSEEGPSGSINSAGWIEADDIGYSTTMTFVDPSRHDKSLMTTQVLVGQSDTLVGFPLSVRSKLVLGNLTTDLVPVTGEIVFSDNVGGIMEVPLQAAPLNPNEVRMIDLNDLKAQAAIPSSYPSASISLNESAIPGSIIARVYGSSVNGNLGFYWALQNYAGWAYDESYWSIQGAWTTVTAVANFGTVEDTVSITITSNLGEHALPAFKLLPGESRTINLTNLAQQRGFPSMQSGGLRIIGGSSKSHLIVKEHLINPALQLSAPFYGDAPYVSSVQFYSSSYTAYIGGDTVLVSTIDNWTNGNQTDGCPYYYYSYDTSIATVTLNGCVGQLSAGSSVGNTSITANESDPDDGSGDYGEFDADAQANSACATPTNYSQNFTGASNGTLNWNYTWASSTGNKRDIQACTTGETVTYPGGNNPYVWPAPMVQSTPNPTNLQGSMNAGGFTDQNSPPSSYNKPYSASNFDATQKIWWNCPCYQNNAQQTQFTNTISRKVFQNASGIWQFTITKANQSTTVNLPNQ